MWRELGEQLGCAFCLLEEVVISFGFKVRGIGFKV